ncbi:SRPBCC domain-containing protein [Actinomadura sp. 6N118]|uniref:SRPBCC domain-containing protein n=1 Tax=Actinomadura sp. 6N118 TaxID=3375151 RepID=UPI0037BBD8AD
MSTLHVDTPGETDIVMSREFDAPRELVFAAWTRPELLRRWLGARGWHLTRCEVDLRAGGRYRFEWAGPDGQFMANGGVYRTVAAPARLVFTERFDDQSYPGETLITHDFTELGGTTTVTSTLRFASREARDRVLAHPMARGVAEGYTRLDQALKENLMNWTLEVVIVPVTDLDAAKEFYADQLGFNVDHDTKVGEDQRIIQLTPPGSGCSVVIGTGIHSMKPGSLQGLQLVVNDLHKARAQLVERGVDVSEITVFGPEGKRPEQEGDDLNNAGFVFFSDPDGNSWAVQQITNRP